FFCQAEDGIRDFHVTGVQTCALPIFTIDQDAKICFALEIEDRLDFAALLTRAGDEPDLDLTDIHLPSVDELDGIARSPTVLDFDVEPFGRKPALFLGKMHPGLHAPWREIEPDRQLFLCIRPDWRGQGDSTCCRQSEKFTPSHLPSSLIFGVYRSAVDFACGVVGSRDAAIASSTTDPLCWRYPSTMSTMCARRCARR